MIKLIIDDYAVVLNEMLLEKQELTSEEIGQIAGLHVQKQLIHKDINLRLESEPDMVEYWVDDLTKIGRAHV